MNSGTLSGIVTIIFIVVFIGIVWWAFSKRNRKDFEDASRLPFEEEDDGAHTVSRKEEDK